MILTQWEGFSKTPSQTLENLKASKPGLAMMVDSKASTCLPLT